MDLNRLSQGEKILGVSAIALFLLSFLPFWAKYQLSAEGVGEASESFSAWDAYYGFTKLGIICALLAFVVVAAKAAGAKLEIPWTPIYLGLAGVTLLAIVMALVLGPDDAGSGGFFGVEIEVSRGIGIFLGTLLAAAMAVGAWLHKGNAPLTAGTDTGAGPGAPADQPPAF